MNSSSIHSSGKKNYNNVSEYKNQISFNGEESKSNTIDYKTLEKLYQKLKKEKKDQEQFYKNELKQNLEIISDLREDNSSLKKQLSEQIQMYNALLIDFSEQQNLLEQKNLKVAAQIEKLNFLAEEISKLKFRNYELEEEVKKIEKEKKYNEKLQFEAANDNECEKKKLFEELEKMAANLKCLKHENKKLCKENLQMANQIKIYCSEVAKKSNTLNDVNRQHYILENTKSILEPKSLSNKSDIQHILDKRNNIRQSEDENIESAEQDEDY